MSIETFAGRHLLAGYDEHPTETLRVGIEAIEREARALERKRLRERWLDGRERVWFTGFGSIMDVTITELLADPA